MTASPAARASASRAAEARRVSPAAMASMTRPVSGDDVKKPSEYCTDNWFATFWFETGRGDLRHLIDQVGEDDIMLETDFPHPTSLHPDPVGMVSEKISTLRPETQRKVMGENAAKLYRV